MKKFFVPVLAFLLAALMFSSCGEKEIPAKTVALPEPLSPLPQHDDTDYQSLVRQNFDTLAESPDTDFSYDEQAGGIRILSYLGAQNHVRIPAQIGGKDVTSLAGGAFENQDQMTVLFIPDTVTSFGKNILCGCDELYALHTPLPLTAGADFFGYLFGATEYRKNNVASLRNLDFLQIGGNPASIPDNYFYDCNDLCAVTLPSSVKSLGNYAFFLCESLHSVNVENLVSIGNHAFENCGSLESLLFADTLIGIGASSLEGCSALQTLTLPFVGGSRTEHRYLGYLFGAADVSQSAGFYPASLHTVILLPGCGNIADYAFFECSSLRELRISANETTLTSVGVRAFSGCSDLSSLTFPDSLTSLREDAFSGCVRLKTILLGTNLITLGVNCFLGCVSLESVTIPEGVSTLPNSCFSGCQSLSTVNLSNVKNVGKQAFHGCVSLTSVISDHSVKFDDGNSTAKELLNR